MTLKIEKLAPYFHPDELGVLCALNSAIARLPYETGKAISNTIFALPLPHSVTEGSAYLDKIIQAFADHQAKPFAGTSLALVGCVDPISHQTTLARVMPLLEGATCYDISKAATGEFLTSDNALRMTGGNKVNYLISGNVLNAPDNPSPQDTFRACGHLLKKDGLAIHMTGYGESVPGMQFDDKRLLDRAGQEHLYNYPDTRYNTGRETTIAMVFLQDHEVGQSVAAPALAPVTTITDQRFYSMGKVAEPTPSIDKGRPPGSA